MIPTFQRTTLATPTLDLAHSRARYPQTPVILKARGVPEMYFTRRMLSHGSWDARGNGRVGGIARRAAPVHAPFSQPLLHAGERDRLAVAAVRFVMI